MSNKHIIFYGTPWCGDCHRARAVLDRNKVQYEFVDIAQDADAAARVEEINHGMRSVPTILFPDGSVLVEPEIAVLKQHLKI